MEKFTKMKRKDLEHYLFIANQIYDTQTVEIKAEIDFANAELERRTAKKGSPLTKAQKEVLSSIKSQHEGSIESNTANRLYNAGTIRKLLEKGVLEVKGHSRLRQDDMEMVYWSTYEVVSSKLEQVLK
jgi:hypothetical protein